jgi:hypothetical protein
VICGPSAIALLQVEHIRAQERAAIRVSDGLKLAMLAWMLRSIQPVQFLLTLLAG